MLQQTLAVFLVLGLLLGALWLLRRQGLATFNFVAASKRIAWRTGPPRRMRVIERSVLTPQHSLHLVSIDNRLIVFSAYPGGCQALDLTSFSAPGEVANVSIRNAASC